MNPDFLPYSLPDLGQEEIDEVVEVLRSGWITTGPRTLAFEKDFARYIGGGVEAVAVNSATAGLHLALKAAGIQEGDEVITSTFTFTATAEAIQYVGATPVLVDIDPSTLNLDPDEVKKKIGSRTRALLPVHFGGLACPMQRLMELAKQHDLKIIEDAAHALPATSSGERIGSLETTATVFSFYATKTITTAEGGMIVTKDNSLADRMRTLRLHGISRDAFDRYQSEKPAWHYEVVDLGYKYNLTDIASAMGLHQLKKADLFQEKRQKMALRYNQSLAGLPIELPPDADSGDTHSWHLYVIRLLHPEINRNDFIQKMADAGIGCSVHFIPLHLHPHWQSVLNIGPEQFPHAQKVFERTVSLPLYTRMTEEQQTRVVDTIHSILG